MKNKLLLQLFCVLCISIIAINNPLSASPVDLATARKAATHFYNWKVGRSVEEKDASLAFIQYVGDDVSDVEGRTPAFYVFNFGNHFVMMSADTRIKPVLGYSTESAFITESMPEQTEWFFGEYVREIENIYQTVSEEECGETAAKWRQLVAGELPVMATNATAVVGPLLTTKWDQNSPYNSQCPSDSYGPGGHAYAGCVACAISQIIRYWSYPPTGVGSHSYLANFSSQGYGDYGLQSADFSSGNYDYSLMPNSLNGATQAQIDEVSKLMYHCGVAVDMMYGPNGSGGYDHKAVNAFNNYFGFNGVELKNSTDYSSTAWINLLKNELNNMRPVYYCGSGSGGHAFVCDGYDSDDYFHFNWGWRGSYDGFYALTDMTPGSHQYNSNHRAIIGIDAAHPMMHTATHSMSFMTEDGNATEDQSILVLATALSAGITATVTGNFRISTDNSNYSTSRTLSTSGGTLYVRHLGCPVGVTDYGTIYLASGSLHDTIRLSGRTLPVPSCTAPQNLSVSSQDLQHIDIQWDAMNANPDPHTLTWSSGVVATNYYYYSDVKFSMMQRYCDSDLVAYHRQALTSISFYPKSGVTVYKAVVYKGGRFDGDLNPGTLVLSQDIDLNSLTPDVLNTITLNTPVMVDAFQELWFGIYAEAPANTTFIPVSFGNVPSKSCVSATHGANGSANWSEFSSSLSFCIQGLVENVQTVTSYEVSRNGVVIGNTEGNSLQDEVSSTGTYHYQVTAHWSNGCDASSERSFTNVASITTTPEALDFFSNQGYGTFVKTVNVQGNGLSAGITATVNGNFTISTDGVTYSTTQSLSSMGGVLYVKYTPSSYTLPFENGEIMFTSGTISAVLPLSGQSYNECYPPQNLTVTQSGNMVMLDWDAPADQVIQSQEVSWCVSPVSLSYGSASSATNRYMVQRYDVNDLAPYHGKQLTAVSFIADSGATMYKIVVYQGGGLNGNTYLRSGTKVREQNVNLSSLSHASWNEIRLDQPVTIDATQELWFGIYVEAPANSYPIRIGNPYVAKKGIISKTSTQSDNSWKEYLGSSYNYSFALKGTIEDSPITLSYYQIDRDGVSWDTVTDTYYNDLAYLNGTYHYDVWAVWNNGCRSTAHKSITLSGLCDPQGTAMTVDACDSYTWYNGVTYNQSGVYENQYMVDGCPVVDTLYLTINHGTHNVVTQTACESYTWHGQTYTTSGTYEYVYTNASDCPSVDTLHLTVNHGTHNVETVSVCGSYKWHGQTYTTSGTYEYAYTNASNCPSADTLHLTILPADYAEFAEVACEEYVWGNQTITASGDYTRTYTNAAGCDSVVTLHLTINHGTHNVVTQTACESYTWHGTTYTTSGAYEYAYTNSSDCPSVDMLHLTINNPVHQSYTETAYDSYTWTAGNGQTYTQSGTYYYTHNDIHNCTQVDTLYLTVYYSSTNEFTATACESYEWDGVTYTATGDYPRHYTDIHGADSLVTLHLTINHGTHNVVTQIACESYTWHGTTYTMSGTYEYAYTNSSDCPSVDTLKLTINPVYNTPITAAICEGSSYDFFGQTLTTAGTYTHTLQSVAGCDSVITLTLTVNPAEFAEFAEVACEEYTWNNETFTVSGDYTRTFTNATGCDSIVTLHLTINPAYNINICDTAVRGHAYVFGVFSITPSDTGTYTYDFQYSTEDGCDSVIHLMLYVMNNDGIAPYEFPDVEVFPNPTNNILNIKGEDMRQILIYDDEGKLVYASKELSSSLETVDVTRYAAGQYFVKIILGNKQIVTKKVIVNRK